MPLSHYNKQHVFETMHVVVESIVYSLGTNVDNNIATYCSTVFLNRNYNLFVLLVRQCCCYYCIIDEMSRVEWNIFWDIAHSTVSLMRRFPSYLHDYSCNHFQCEVKGLASIPHVRTEWKLISEEFSYLSKFVKSPAEKLEKNNDQKWRAIRILIIR